MQTLLSSTPKTKKKHQTLRYNKIIENRPIVILIKSHNLKNPKFIKTERDINKTKLKLRKIGGKISQLKFQIKQMNQLCYY